MHITEKEANVKKGYILYDSNYTTFWKKQSYRNSFKKGNGCQGGVGGGDELGVWD